jgi:hypothetical protein
MRLRCLKGECDRRGLAARHGEAGITH